MSEPLTRLAELPSAEPDHTRAQRVRVRCHTRLGQQTSRHPLRVVLALTARRDESGSR